MGELGDLTGHLHTGRAGTDDHEGQQVVDVLAAQSAELGHLEGTEDPPAQLQGVVDGLHAGGELGEVVVAEVGLGGPGGDQERVVRRHRLAAQHLGDHEPPLEVDLGDLAEQDLGVLLPAEDLAGGRRDLALGEDAGRHLVEQRLEEVVGRLGDHRDVDCRAAQRLGAEEPAEAGPDDDDPVLAGALLGHGLHGVLGPGGHGSPCLRLSWCSRRPVSVLRPRATHQCLSPTPPSTNPHGRLVAHNERRRHRSRPRGQQGPAWSPPLVKTDPHPTGWVREKLQRLGLSPGRRGNPPSQDGTTRSPSPSTTGSHARAAQPTSALARSGPSQRAGRTPLGGRHVP